MGAGLELGYFAQAHEGLDPDRTVLEEVFAVRPEMKRSEARDFLARFLFAGDSIAKPIASLSGGERGRVALAKLALQGANLLLLDEPTNHLDLPSQEVLQQALAEFPGTILLVSHDRYLVDALATQVWAITPSERELQVYAGGYAAYLDAKQRVAEVRQAPRRRPLRRAAARDGPSRREVEVLEARIADLEDGLAETTAALERAGGDIERVRTLGARYAELERELEEQLERWENLARQLHAPPPAAG